MTVSNLLSTNVVVILVSVYNNKLGVDYSTIYYMVHTTRCILQTQKGPNGSFSHSWSHIMYMNRLITFSMYSFIGDGSSRTTLKWNGEQGSDYINASFIDVKLTYSFTH